MDIFSIQPSSHQYDPFSTRKRADRSSEDYRERQTGADTVTFSDEALALAGKSSTEADTAGKNESQYPWQDDQVEKTGKVSLKEQGTSLLGMMLQSYFMESLENTEERTDADGESTSKSKSVLTETDKAAQLKKFMDDFAKGKVEITELPEALAGSYGGKAAANKRNASTGGDGKGDTRPTLG